MLLYWLHRLPYQAYPEERLRKALDHQISAPQSEQDLQNENDLKDEETVTTHSAA
jgi:hypothetical protein